jgi:hypothetical protein
MNEPAFTIRHARSDDYPALLALSPRLAIGIAPWRDPGTAPAVRGWIESSLAATHLDGHAVLVAVLNGQVEGMVSLAERRHFTGDLDAYDHGNFVFRGNYESYTPANIP